MRSIAATNDIEELRLELLRDRPDDAVTDRAVINLAHWRDLSRSAGEEDLIRKPELVARDAPFLNGDPHFAGKRDDAVPRDALEDGGREIRRVEDALFHDEDVLA